MHFEINHDLFSDCGHCCCCCVFFRLFETYKNNSFKSMPIWKVLVENYISVFSTYFCMSPFEMRCLSFIRNQCSVNIEILSIAFVCKKCILFKYRPRLIPIFFGRTHSNNFYDRKSTLLKVSKLEFRHNTICSPVSTEWLTKAIHFTLYHS